MKKVYLVDYDLCSPFSCGRPCISKCPISLTNARKKPHQKKEEVPIRWKKSENRIIIKSEFCIGCGICVNVCPRKAIYSQYLLSEPESQPIIHEYSTLPPSLDSSFSPNRGFRLYGLPVLKKGKVTGLCGPNGIGKSTVLNILSGDLIPNFGKVEKQKNKKNNKFSYNESLFRQHIKENEMRSHFRGLYRGEVKVAYKKQVLKILFKQYKGKKVIEILEKEKSVSETVFDRILTALDIYSIADRYLDECSGGELQRFAIASVLIREASCYLIDEPATFLDVKKRIVLADLLQERARGLEGSEPKPVLVVEHDLAILDYVSDVVHLFYGKPHQFGVLTKVLTTKAGINAYLNGFLKTENIQFRKKKIGFKRTISGRSWENAQVFIEFPEIHKTYPSFHLTVRPGTIYKGEILGIVGENGTGKSTFAKLLVGIIKPDSPSSFEGIPAYISYKPQYINRNFKGTVREFIMEYSEYRFEKFLSQALYEPLGLDKLFDKTIQELSGGELQRVFISACLSKRADLYILDEPSAYLDVEERLHIASVIRSMTKFSNATTLCIEHDIQIADALADRLMIFSGIPGKEGFTVGPLDKREGMNQFLKILDITFRRDEETGRARINKKGSRIDRLQRASGEYFYAPQK